MIPEAHGWKTLLRCSLIGRRGELVVSASGPVSVEDVKMLEEVLAIWKRGCVPVDELKTHYECGQEDPPHWHGPGEDRVPVFGSGRSGCPLCGGATRPALGPPGPDNSEREEGS